MGFIPISINAYIKKHLENNVGESEKNLRKRLDSALADYKKGIRCACGNDIWVIGSASVGNSCFTCIIGESYPTGNYEIESAIDKRENIKGRRHIDDIPPAEIAGFFDDDGFEIKMELIKKPFLCVACINNDDLSQDVLCNMTRYDQKNEEEFKCFAYKPKKSW